MLGFLSRLFRLKTKVLVCYRITCDSTVLHGDVVLTMPRLTEANLRDARELLYRNAMEANPWVTAERFTFLSVTRLDG